MKLTNETRKELLRAIKASLTGYEGFPPDGRCYHCQDDIVAQAASQGFSGGVGEKADVSGCRSCHRSFC